MSVGVIIMILVGCLVLYAAFKVGAILLKIVLGLIAIGLVVWGLWWLLARA